MCKYCEFDKEVCCNGPDFGRKGIFEIIHSKYGYYIEVTTNNSYDSFDPESVIINFCPMCRRKLTND